MKVFEKVKIIITSGHINGHALRNIQNKKSIAIAKVEIEKMLKV